MGPIGNCWWLSLLFGRAGIRRNAPFRGRPGYRPPFDPSTSHLFLKIRGEESGGRMPLGGPYLDETQENAIRDWILEGATDN